MKITKRIKIALLAGVLASTVKAVQAKCVDNRDIGGCLTCWNNAPARCQFQTRNCADGSYHYSSCCGSECTEREGGEGTNPQSNAYVPSSNPIVPAPPLPGPVVPPSPPSPAAPPTSGACANTGFAACSAGGCTLPNGQWCAYGCNSNNTGCLPPTPIIGEVPAMPVDPITCATQIDGFYQDLLGRQPDAAGFAGWIDVCTSGTMSLDEISSAFLGSDDYRQNHTQAGCTAYVTMLYQTLLGRAPDPSGLGRWVGNCTSNALTLGQIRQDFLTCPEYSSKH